LVFESIDIKTGMSSVIWLADKTLLAFKLVPAVSPANKLRVDITGIENNPI
jgi:hypothetical protein